MDERARLRLLLLNAIRRSGQDPFVGAPENLVMTWFDQMDHTFQTYLYDCVRARAFNEPEAVRLGSELLIHWSDWRINYLHRLSHVLVAHATPTVAIDPPAPRTAHLLLHAFLPYRDRDVVERDLEEQLLEESQDPRIGPHWARAFYSKRVLENLAGYARNNAPLWLRRALCAALVLATARVSGLDLAGLATLKKVLELITR